MTNDEMMPKPGLHKTFGQLDMLPFNQSSSEVFTPYQDELDANSGEKLQMLVQTRQSCFADSDFGESDRDYLQHPASSANYQTKYRVRLIDPLDNLENADIFGATQMDADFPKELLMEWEVQGATQEHLEVYTGDNNRISTKNDNLQSSFPNSSIEDVDIYAKHTAAQPPTGAILRRYMLIVNDIVLVSTKPNSLIVELKPHKMLQNQLTCFGMGEWITDDVVLYYMTLIQKRNAANPTECQRVYSFPPTFYALLSQANGLNTVKESAVGDNIFEHDLIFIPVCQSHHWRLIVVDVKEKSVTTYNSQSFTKDLLIINKIVSYLNHEYKRLYPGLQPPEWKKIPEKEVPQQNNTDDCGIFMLQFADYLSKRRPLDFDASHMTYFRARMLYECISGRLLAK